MKRLDSNVSAVQVALEQAPEILKPVSVDAPVDVPLSVIHNIMHIPPIQFVVSGVTIGINGRPMLDLFENLSLQTGTAHIGNYFSSNLTRIAVKHSHHDSF